jgi:hypothetical protein
MEVARHETPRQRFAGVLRLLQQLESKEEQVETSWRADPRPVQDLFDALAHSSLSCLFQSAQSETYGFGNQPIEWSHFYLACFAAQLRGYAWPGTQQEVLTLDVALDPTAVEDYMVLYPSVEPDPSDLAAQMDAQGVGDSAEDQLAFVLSQMSPKMRREFDASAGAVSTSFEFDEDDIDSEGIYAQDHD